MATICIQWAKKEDDKKRISTILTNIGNCYKRKGDYKSALTNFQKALKHTKGSYHIKYNLGLIHLKLGNHKSAMEHFQSAKEDAQKNNKYYLSSILIDIGNVYSDLGQLENALNTYLECLKVSRETSSKIIEGGALTNIANVLSKQEKYATGA